MKRIHSIAGWLVMAAARTRTSAAMLATAAVLTMGMTACSNDDDAITAEPTTAPTAIMFNLTATHPDDGATTRGTGGNTGGWHWEAWGDDDAEAQGTTRAVTRAVKTGWESGDAIFVFFSNVAAPKHLKMTFDGAAWTDAEYNGATQTDGALGLTNGMTGTMRAVYLPFGSTATVSADGTSFKFSETQYSYYLTATLAYTVTNNAVSGAFNMTIPEGFVQFYAENEYTIKKYTLGCDAVIPTGIASIAADGTVVETSGMPFNDYYYGIVHDPYALDLPGYSYGDGDIYSGKLKADYGYNGSSGFQSYGPNYYFALSTSDHSSRKDYFVTGKTLQSHSAVKLPKIGNSFSLGFHTDKRWIDMGADKSVKFGDIFSHYTFNTCNYNELGSIYPEEIGTRMNFSDAKTATDNQLLNADYLVENCSHTPLSIHGYCGMVVYQGTNFIFLPSAGAIPYGLPDYSLFSNTYWGYDIGGGISKFLEFSTDKFEVKTTGESGIDLYHTMSVRASWK